ncbi:Myo-inositol 2-dehydrogenase [Sulfitobacter sp. DSM 110093]|uniref:Gfo/Idh/MocA family protein n=1 Tax=Sulfitobacter sp. DSM 110093 TaxID=2883127 RepID=UPI001FAE1AAE|nr:Gfo/Idh/MocA family oxidoreductase [Sulfitobacter sp. DSM 110093]UOA32847.1 Myo-inositol 2-dehydrogenase [Sulfitobacter sp. DSM 110093]
MKHPLPSEDRPRIRLGLIGCGEHATTVLHSAVGFIDDFEVVGVCDIDTSRAQAAARRFSLAEYHDNHESLLQEARPDAVLLVTYPALQPKLTNELLQAGIHVYVEKPIVMTNADVVALSHTQKEHPNLVAAVSFNKRFSPHYQRVKEIVSGEGFGSSNYFHFRFAGGHRATTWDLLAVGAIHGFDMARNIMGEIEEVSAYFVEPNDGQADISANVRFRSGAIGQFFLSSMGFWSAKGAEHMDIRSNQNVVTLENHRQLTWQGPPLEKSKSDTTQMQKETPSFAQYLEPNYSNVSAREFQSIAQNGYLQPLQIFAQDILNGSRRLPTLDDGVAALNIAKAIDQSMRDGGQTVKVETA